MKTTSNMAHLFPFICTHICLICCHGLKSSLHTYTILYSQCVTSQLILIPAKYQTQLVYLQRAPSHMSLCNELVSLIQTHARTHTVFINQSKHMVIRCRTFLQRFALLTLPHPVQPCNYFQSVLMDLDQAS